MADNSAGCCPTISRFQGPQKCYERTSEIAPPFLYSNEKL